MKEPKGMKIIFIVFAIIGAVLIVGGTKYLQSSINFKNNAIETQATITDIERYRDSDGDSHYNVFVEFEVDGEIYGGELGYYSSGMYRGGTTKVYYNPNNPDDFRSSSDTGAGIIIMIMGIVFFLVGFGMLVGNNVKSKNNKKILETGTKIYAQFEEVRRNMRFSYNGKNPYQIVCTSDNPDIDEYVSENIWRNPKKIIEERNITAFPVYIDPENPRKYYLSTEEIEEYIALK